MVITEQGSSERLIPPIPATKLISVVEHIVRQNYAPRYEYNPDLFQNTNPALGTIHNHSDHRFCTECGVTRGCDPFVRNDSKPSEMGPEKGGRVADRGGAAVWVQS